MLRNLSFAIPILLLGNIGCTDLSHDQNTDSKSLGLQQAKSYADSSNQRPVFPIQVVIFIGEDGSRSCCSSTSTISSEQVRVLKSGLSCGWPGEVSELSWEFIGSNDGKDKYRFERRFPVDTGHEETTTIEISYEGERKVLWSDDKQVIVVEPVEASS